MEKYIHISYEILDLGCNIKNSEVWLFLCRENRPCSLQEISSCYKLSEYETKKALDEMANIGAVLSEVIDDNLYYLANPETYRHSNEI